MHLLRVSGLSPGPTVAAASLAGLELTELWWRGEESLCGPASWAVFSSTTSALAIEGVTQKQLLSHGSTHMSSHMQPLGGTFFFLSPMGKPEQISYVLPSLSSPLQAKAFSYSYSPFKSGNCVRIFPVRMIEEWKSSLTFWVSPEACWNELS